MTMYLPNHEVRPTGAELAEFIDASSAVDLPGPVPAVAAPAGPEPHGDGRDAASGAGTPAS
jgi:hypothetical protein